MTFHQSYRWSEGAEQLYHKCIHHFLAWGVCAFPQLINILRVCFLVRVTAVFLNTLRVGGVLTDTRERRENNDNVISKQCFRSKSTLLMLPVF